MERDRRRIELMNSLLFSMPGAPVIYYGDELGMGDNIRLGDRDGCAHPCSGRPTATAASRARSGGAGAARDHGRALRLRDDQCRGPDARRPFAAALDAPQCWPPRQHRLRPRGLRFLYPLNRKVLAYLRELDGEVILCVATSRTRRRRRARPLGIQQPRAG